MRDVEHDVEPAELNLERTRIDAPNPCLPPEIEQLIDRIHAPYMANLRALCTELRQIYSVHSIVKDEQIAEISQRIQAIEQHNAALLARICELEDPPSASTNSVLVKLHSWVAWFTRRSGASH